MEKKQVVQIDPNLHQKLKMMALRRKTTLKMMVHDILTAAVAKQ